MGDRTTEKGRGGQVSKSNVRKEGATLKLGQEIAPSSQDICCNLCSHHV